MYDFYMNGMLSSVDDHKMLLVNSRYSDTKQKPIEFIYDYRDTRLIELREKYNLLSVAGMGGDFQRMLRITLWLANKLTLGQRKQIDSFHALSILDESNQGVPSNCYITANVLQECFLSLGYVARMVRCMPIDLRFNECHCITSSYVGELNKFVAFDASLGGCYVNQYGTPMSISEIRQALINNDEIHLRTIFSHSFIKSFRPYLTKNFVRFQSHRIIKYDTENSKDNALIINLNPISLPMENKLDANQGRKYLFTYNEESFWHEKSIIIH